MFDLLMRRGSQTGWGNASPLARGFAARTMNKADWANARGTQ